MLSITFQGLCGIAQCPNRLGSDVFLPYNAEMPHTGMLCVRATDLQKPSGLKADEIWQPDGLGLDHAGHTICFWFLHHPRTPTNNLDDMSGQRLAIVPRNGTELDVAPPVFSRGKKIVPLAAQYDPNKTHSTDREFGEGTKICLPNGWIMGTGEDAMFDLRKDPPTPVRSTGDDGPYAEHVRWESLFLREPDGWLIVNFGGAQRRFIPLVAGASATVTNAVPFFGVGDPSSHFSGIYEAVRQKTANDDPIDKNDRFSLVRHGLVSQSVDEGVNCIPPGETPPSDDPPPPPPAP